MRLRFPHARLLVLATVTIMSVVAESAASAQTSGAVAAPLDLCTLAMGQATVEEREAVSRTVCSPLAFLRGRPPTIVPPTREREPAWARA
jgi:hypothetical protein